MPCQCPEYYTFARAFKKGLLQWVCHGLLSTGVSQFLQCTCDVLHSLFFTLITVGKAPHLSSSGPANHLLN